MNKKRLLLSACGICIIIGIVMITSASKQNAVAFAGIPDTAESQSIQDTIIRSYQIEAVAAGTFDTTAFSDVFVNDPQGGSLIPNQLNFMQDVTSQPAKTDFGYLDYKLAFYTWWGKGAVDFEKLQAKMDEENRNPTTEEMQTLVDSTGRIAPARLTSDDVPEIEFISISIDGDQAIATFDDGPNTNQMILVKIGTNWFIAGNKILDSHP